MYSEYAYQSDPEEDEPSADITLDEVGLCKGQKFALHYDFGDDWMFTITVSKSVKFRGILSLALLSQKVGFNSIQTGMKMSLTKNNVMLTSGES